MSNQRLLVILSSVLLFSAWSCDSQPVDEVGMGAVKNPHGCETCLWSSRDNPPVELTASLGFSKGPNGQDLYEYAAGDSAGSLARLGRKPA